MLDTVRPTDRERFWNKVNFTPTQDGCVEWTGATAKGYGTMRWKHDRMRQATRIAWELFWGTEPETDLLHSCDNRLCISILHLREGTAVENSTDMHDRNPSSLAEGAHSRSLTYAEVDELRRMYRTGEFSAQNLADGFGVSQTVVSAAVSGRSYKRGPIEAPVPFLGRGRRSQKVG